MCEDQGTTDARRSRMSDKSIPPDDPKSTPRVSLFGRPAAAGKSSLPPAPTSPKRRRPRGSGLSQLSAFLSFVLIGAVIGLVAFGAALVEARRPGPLIAEKTVLITRED